MFGHRGNCSEPINLGVFVLHKRSGSEARKDERISYECRIKRRVRILLARDSGSSFYSVRMQTTARSSKAASHLWTRAERLHGTHSLRVEENHGKSDVVEIVGVIYNKYYKYEI